MTVLAATDAAVGCWLAKRFRQSCWRGASEPPAMRNSVSARGVFWDSGGHGEKSGSRGTASDPFWARVRELEHTPGRHVRRQHLVSKVLLKRFTAPGSGGAGPQLYPFDLRHPHQSHKLKGPAGCGWAENFVSFASGTLEDLWARTEQDLPGAFRALDAGRILDEVEHHALLRDFLALHWVRSYFYRDAFDRIFTEFRARSRHWFLTDGRDLVRTAALQECGLHIAGLEGLQHMVDDLLRPTDELFPNGALMRIHMEEMFNKVRDRISAAGLQIHPPESGEFLIGDTPAQTIRFDHGHPIWGVAIRDAASMIIPLGPKHLLSLGRESTLRVMSNDDREAMNRVQILSAVRYVYYRPQSGLERTVLGALKAHGAGQFQ
ncbi:DUF4238 domain-containing protein [Streptomyces vinaceus]|uniref:DUF4238 domain-containing protein n=1 Tax=Streptomyces vinaceus TaxID=1960 RepID=UPI00380A1472